MKVSDLEYFLATRVSNIELFNIQTNCEQNLNFNTAIKCSVSMVETTHINKCLHCFETKVVSWTSITQLFPLTFPNPYTMGFVGYILLITFGFMGFYTGGRRCRCPGRNRQCRWNNTVLIRY